MTEGRGRRFTPQSSGVEVCLENLTKIFGDVTAVDDVSLRVRPGEFLTLLGPSGSGKTTTLLMIAGFEMATEGEIQLDGDSITYRPPHKRNIGMVFQKYALFPHMTVAQNIGFPLKMRGVGKSVIAEEVRGALEIVRLSGYEQRYPSQLSGGQQQRIALARAVVFQPDVLLMDEPLGALDKKLREDMQLEIKRIHEELGITVVYVTHDQAEALTMSDRIAVLNEGRIEQLGTPSELYESPANLFVADFIGESNCFSGRVAEVANGVCSIVTEDDHTLNGPAVEGVPVGDQVCFVVRPERIRFADGPDDGPNVIKGVVKEVIYVGDTTKYLIETPRGETLVLKHYTRHNQIPYQRGQDVAVTWTTADVVTLCGPD